MALVVTLSFAGCDLQNQNMKSKGKGYEGAGAFSFVSKAGLLASKGALLQFDEFDVASGYDNKLSMKNIPVLNQPYRLFFVPDTKIAEKDVSYISIHTILKDDSGNILWHVDSMLDQWIVSEGGEVVEYYYMDYAATNNTDCKFFPKKNEAYVLSIVCSTQKSDQPTTLGNARFLLRAGGFK